MSKLICVIGLIFAFLQASNLYLSIVIGAKGLRPPNKISYNFYNNQEWNNFENYDIAINMDAIGIEKTVQLLKSIIVNIWQLNKNHLLFRWR